MGTLNVRDVQQGGELAEADTHVNFNCIYDGGDSGLYAAAFAFTDGESGETIAGPLTAILALSGKELAETSSAGDKHVS